MSDRQRTCTSEYCVHSPDPANPRVKHALHARCDQPADHRGLHEGSDPFEPANRIMWDRFGKLHQGDDGEIEIDLPEGGYVRDVKFEIELLGVER